MMSKAPWRAACLATLLVASSSSGKVAGKKTGLTPASVVLELPLAGGEKLQLTLEQVMRKFHVPGLSIAVVDDYRIVWARGFGVTAPDGTGPVTTTTLFQAGSISKPVSAAGALWLVEHGKLN